MAKLPRISIMDEPSNNFAKLPDELLQRLPGNEVKVYGAMVRDAFYNHKAMFSDISNIDIAKKYNLTRQTVAKCRKNLIESKIIIAKNTKEKKVKQYECLHKKCWFK